MIHLRSFIYQGNWCVFWTLLPCHPEEVQTIRTFSKLLESSDLGFTMVIYENFLKIIFLCGKLWTKRRVGGHHGEFWIRPFVLKKNFLINDYCKDKVSIVWHPKFLNFLQGELFGRIQPVAAGWCRTMIANVCLAITALWGATAIMHISQDIRCPLILMRGVRVTLRQLISSRITLKEREKSNSVCIIMAIIQMNSVLRMHSFPWFFPIILIKILTDICLSLVFYILQVCCIGF